MNSINPNGSRVYLSHDDSLRSILSLVHSPSLKVLQFNQKLPLALLEGLNSEFFTQRPDVELRVFGFYGDVCDLSFCAFMPNVERFRADCLQQAKGVENISKMQRLISLGIGIHNLDSFAFLDAINPRINALWLAQTKSKKPGLSHLSRFKNLQSLCLAGQQKKIETVSQLTSLEKLTLISITLESLDLVRTLPLLNSFDLSLGGTKDLSALTSMTTLKNLELWKILGLDNIEVLSSLIGLETILLQSLTRVASLPSLEKLVNLRKIVLDDMKGLTDISALATAPALSELSHFSSRLPIEEYLLLLRKGTLKTANVGFGSLTKNGKFHTLCEKYSVLNSVAYK